VTDISTVSTPRSKKLLKFVSIAKARRPLIFAAMISSAIFFL
jgi:hypothetical protein